MSNAFETGLRKVIPAVLVYLERDGQLLMLHRNAKPGDYHQGKYNGLGGKLDPDESPRQAALREVAEEAGVTLPASAYRLLGTLQFPNFKPKKSEDWVVWVFTAQVPHGQNPWPQGPEGELKWIPKADVLKLNLWQGDRHFIPHVLANQPFAGTIWYEGENVVNHEIETLS